MAFGFQNPLQQSFGFQSPAIPKKKEEEKLLMTSMYPGFNDQQVKMLEEDTKDFPIEERVKKQQEIYKEVLPQIENKKIEDQRIMANNNLYRESIQEKDPQRKKMLSQQIKVNEFSSEIKKKYNLMQSAPDDSVLDALFSDQPNLQPLFTDYLNGKNEDILYELNLKERPVEKKPSDFQEFITPIASFTQGVSDVGQGIVGKPIKRLAEKAGRGFLKAFGYTDNELDQYEQGAIDENDGDITSMLGGAENTLISKGSREVGKIAGSASLTAGIPRGAGLSIAGKSGAELIKNVLLRTAIEGGRGLAETAAYNVASTGTTGEPVSLALGAGIGATLGGPLGLIGSKIVSPGVKALTTKLQLSGLLNRARLDRLSTILKQGGAEELAKGTPEDVANRMLQRDIKGSKATIVKKLEDIKQGSMELLDNSLSSDTRLFQNESIDESLDLMQEFYKGSKSQKFKDKALEIEGLITKNQEGGLTLKEVNNLKKTLYDDVNLFTDSGKVKVAKEDLASLSRELKNIVEEGAESPIGVKLLNNEYAMANSMKQAIEQKLNTDMIGEILSFVSNRGGTSVIGAIAGGTGGGPFDGNTTIGKLGNILVGFSVGRFASSTQAKTAIASMLKKFTGVEKAAIMKYLSGKADIKDIQGGQNIIKKLNNELIDVLPPAKPNATTLTDNITPDNIPGSVKPTEAPKTVKSTEKLAKSEKVSTIDTMKTTKPKKTYDRAGAKDQFNEGDLVTLSKKYAQEHMERVGSKGVFSKKVKAKDIHYAGDDINEFGYYPSKPKNIYNKPKSNIKEVRKIDDLKDLSKKYSSKEEFVKYFKEMRKGDPFEPGYMKGVKVNKALLSPQLDRTYQGKFKSIDDAIGNLYDSTKPSISKDLQPLLEEAKKYKSADDFVKKEAIRKKLIEEGTKINKDDTVTLYHATYNKQDILKQGEFKGTAATPGGMVGVDLGDNVVYFGTDKKWVSETRGKGGRDIIEINVPLEYIRKPAQNTTEVYFEGGLKKQGEVRIPNKKPQSTHYDRLAEKTLLSEKEKSQLKKIREQANK